MFMKYRHEDWAAKLMEKLYSEEAGIMRAERAVEGISRDYLKYAREMAITKNKMYRAQQRFEDRAEGLAEGRAEGLAEGHAEGRSEGLAEGRTNEKLEIARNLKKMGLSAQQIVEGTGLSPEIVQKL
jgi:predicted transposase/invertase (TIGR01784 family)